MQLINIVDNKISNNTCSSPNIKKTIIAKGDSAATAHYIRSQDADVLENKTNIKGPTIKQPDNTDLASEGSGTIPLSKHLSAEAQTAMIIPNLKSASLISIGQLCDDGCTAVLDKKDLTVVKKETVILRGKRNKLDGLWDIPIEKRHITTDNFQLPTTHAALYAAKQQRHTVPKIQQRRQLQPVHIQEDNKENDTNINNISYDQCEKIISSQTQQDEKMRNGKRRIYLKSNTSWR